MGGLGLPDVDPSSRLSRIGAIPEGSSFPVGKRGEQLSPSRKGATHTKRDTVFDQSNRLESWTKILIFLVFEPFPI